MAGHVLNDELRRLAEDCGFTPRLRRPYRTKTKRKVESSPSFNPLLAESMPDPAASAIAPSELHLVGPALETREASSSRPRAGSPLRMR